MATMVLLRLPTEQDFNAAGMEAESFLEAFHNKSVGPFTAEVAVDGEYINLDGWSIKQADWFEVSGG